MVQNRSRKTTHIYLKEFEILKVTATRSTPSIMWVLSALIPAGTVVSDYIDRIDIDDLKKKLFYFREVTCIYSPGLMHFVTRLIITCP